MTIWGITIINLKKEKKLKHWAKPRPKIKQTKIINFKKILHNWKSNLIILIKSVKLQIKEQHSSKTLLEVIDELYNSNFKLFYNRIYFLV